jgi:hypothetical protein
MCILHEIIVRYIKIIPRVVDFPDFSLSGINLHFISCRIDKIRTVKKNPDVSLPPLSPFFEGRYCHQSRVQWSGMLPYRCCQAGAGALFIETESTRGFVIESQFVCVSTWSRPVTTRELCAQFNYYRDAISRCDWIHEEGVGRSELYQSNSGGVWFQ